MSSVRGLDEVKASPVGEVLTALRAAPLQFLQKFFQQRNVLHARRGLKAGVEVDAGKLGMAEVFNPLGIFGTYAATEKEGDITVVAVEDRPVEVFAATAYAFTLGVEEQHVNVTLIRTPPFYVLAAADADSLDNLDVRADVGD